MTGEIISKSGAGAYAVEWFPDRWEPTVRACLRVRSQAASPRSRLPAVEARHAVNFMDFVVGDANRRSIRS